MNRYKVGFFTAKHPKVDDKRIGDSHAFIFIAIVTASSEGEAVAKAKAKANLELLKQELLKRWSQAKAVNYTVQLLGKNKPRTWARSFTQWRIIE